MPAQVPSVVVGVDDIQASMDKVRRAGGNVLGEPIDIPGVGKYVSSWTRKAIASACCSRCRAKVSAGARAGAERRGSSDCCARPWLPAAGKVLIGISGWRYEPWRGVFYPRGLPQRSELAYAARICRRSRSTARSTRCSDRVYAEWNAETPPGFVFAVKGARYITHMLKLRDVATPLANFFASGVCG